MYTTGVCKLIICSRESNYALGLQKKLMQQMLHCTIACTHVHVYRAHNILSLQGLPERSKYKALYINHMSTLSAEILCEVPMIPCLCTDSITFPVVVFFIQCSKNSGVHSFGRLGHERNRVCLD